MDTSMTETIRGGIATITGRGVACLNAVNSVPQVQDMKVSKDSAMGDAAKFNGKMQGYYFAFDDDLFYPDNYVETMLSKLKEYDNKIIITCQGRVVDYQPIQSYYKSGWTKYSCLSELTEDKWVHIPGSGVCAFHTDYFKPDLSEFKNGFMADIWLAIQAQKKQIPILCIAHPAGWILQQDVGEGIYEKYKDNDSEQVKAVNSIKWILYESTKKD